MTDATLASSKAGEASEDLGPLDGPSVAAAIKVADDAPEETPDLLAKLRIIFNI